MKHFVGIDLGTTNSAICSYDGENIRVYKSPEQNSVTPSAIYIDRRSRYYGQRAYDFEARSPDNVAVRFKRLIGTNTPIRIPAVKLTMTPEECSAEILRVLFGYLEISGIPLQLGAVPGISQRGYIDRVNRSTAGDSRLVTGRYPRRFEAYRAKWLII